MDFYTYSKKIYYNILVGLGKQKKLLANLDRNVLLILSFHKVNPLENPFYPSLHPKIFEELLAYLQKHFFITNFRNLKNIDNENKPKIILSFDDGYYDFIEYVLPLTQKYKVIPNLNIIGSTVQHGELPWNIILYDFLNQSSIRDIQKIKIPEFHYRIESNTTRAKTKFALKLSAFLKNKPLEVRTKLWQPLYSQIRNSPIHFTRMITLKELLLIKDSCEVGAHSYSHESMAHQSLQFFREDFAKCSEFFNNYLEKRIDIYAFPNGSYKPEFCDDLTNAGVQFILLVNETFSFLKQNILPRITVYGSSLNEAKLIALGIKSKQ